VRCLSYDRLIRFYNEYTSVRADHASRRHRYNLANKFVLTVLFLLALPLLGAGDSIPPARDPAAASSPSAVPSSKTDQTTSVGSIGQADSQEELRQAQAAYYRASEKKIHEAGTLWGWAKDNAAFFGGLAAGVIAFLSFYQSWRAATDNLKLSLENSESERRAQRDTQFYEALKRFGDKDSPSLRASAAALIAQLAGAPNRSEGYLEVAVSQFAAALRIEANTVVIESITDAARFLAGVATEDFVAAQEILERMHRTNLAQQHNLVSAVLRYLLVSGIKPVEKGAWPSEAFTEMAVRMGYRPDVIEALFQSRKFVASFIEVEQSNTMALDDAKRLEERSGLARGLVVLGQQLRASSETIRFCLWALTPDANFAYGHRRILVPKVSLTSGGERDPIDVTHGLREVFLAQLDLKGVNLQGADLSHAWLQYSDLSFAKLQKANLFGAFLSGASLSFAVVEDAYLANADLTNTLVAHIDLTRVNLSGANWWDAEFDYYGSGPGLTSTFDRMMIDGLFATLGSTIPAGVRRRGKVTSLSGSYIASALERQRTSR
jgi:Pentapeptide repeats (8 copies)